MGCRSSLRRAAVLAACLVLPVSSAAATEIMCDPSYQDCRALLLARINSEPLAIDLAMLFMEDDVLADAIIARHREGIRVRILVEPRRNQTTPKNEEILARLKAAGIPMRAKAGGGVLHYKFMIFDALNALQFSAANYSDYYFKPIVPYANYTDEGIYFTEQPSLVDSFRRKFDDAWIDTVGFYDFGNVAGPPARRYGLHDIDPELSFVPTENFASRSVPLYDAEQVRIDAVMYKITEPRHADGLLRAAERRIPVRLITEPDRYRNPANIWQAYHIDRLYTAGVQIRNRAHAGFLHQKSTLLYGQGLTIFGSSNWTNESNQSQYEHNYFTTKTWFFEWFRDNFERKWTNRAGNETVAFEPLPPDVPAYVSPANQGQSVATSGAVLRWNPGPWSWLADVYFGTSPSPPLYRSNVGVAVSETNTFALPALAPGTTYYWKIVSKTMAQQTAEGPIHSFTTAGSTSPPPNAAPSVAITSPAHGSTFTAPATIAVAASATDSDGAVVRVDFYAGSTLLGSDATAPYTFNWGGVPSASYSVTARAIDDDGATAASAPVTVTVTSPAPPPNTAPSVAITSPSHGSTFTAPATIIVAASASDSDGAVVRVDFYAGSTLLGSDATAPYAFNWGGVPAASYSVTARAIDDDGATRTSAAVSVTVSAPAPPPPPPPATLPSPWQSQDIGAVGPAGNATAGSGTFTIAGAGADVWGSADAFRFVWQRVSGDVDVIARVVSVEYVHAWVKAGVMIRERLTADSAHAFMLVSPAKGRPFQRRVANGGLSTSTGAAGVAPAWVKLERRGNAITASVSENGVAWTLVASDSFAMPTEVHVGLAVSSHDATRLATATFDNVTVRPVTSAPPPPPNVAPSVSVTSPSHGSTFTAPATIAVAASAADSDGTVVRVDFYAGSTLIGSDAAAPYAFNWGGVPAASYSVTARAIDDDGATATSAAVSVTVGAAPPPPPPAPWRSQDVGAVGLAGTATGSSGTFTVRGAGADVWGTSDAFHYAWQQLTGDADVVARVASVEYVHAWVKAGVMIREHLGANAAHAFMLVSPGKGYAFQRRMAAGGLSTHTSGGTGTAPAWVKLERRAGTISAFVSADGSDWTLVASDAFTMAATVYVGLAVSSHDVTRLATASFDNVRAQAITAPPPPPPPPPADLTEIVLHAANAAVMAGAWRLEADSTAASGIRAWNPNVGGAKVVTAVAAPANFIELTFNAEAGRPYRLWIRGKAEGDTWDNDSAHVQFSGTVDVQGTAVYRIGTTSSAEFNLESCRACGVAGWGWEDNGWGPGVLGPVLYFATTGPQRIRLQTREDGISFDQIVLSADRFLNVPPGPEKHDTTILSKSQ